MNRERSAFPARGSMLLLALLSAGCLEPRERSGPAPGECTSCHGSAARSGSEIEKSAPPIDLGGGTDPSRPGVGAHQIHLTSSATHGKVACATCHVVPDSVNAPGHADTALPAEVILGGLATHDGRVASYSDSSRSCAGTYCHGSATPKWTEPKSSDQACGSCHGLPPPPPHPAASDCSRCHGEVIAADRTFIAPERHVDGVLDVSGLGCSGCHGSESSDAPPVDLSGNLARSAIGVGAHQAHLSGGANSRALECGECHVVPASVDAPGHIDDTPFAEVVFSGIAQNGGGASWDRENLTCSSSWCHGPSAPLGSTSPAWTSESGPLGCTGCHGAPPPAPHPQMQRCSLCHSQVVAADDVTIIAREKHVDGVVDFNLPGGCSDCHGNADNAAPPKDLAGNLLTAAPGVGAHQSHLRPSNVARTLECNDCHLVPQTVVAPGHMDTPLPAELTWSAIATGSGAKTPSYDGTSCSDSWCHAGTGAANPEPIWTSVGTGQAVCGSCHGVPPPTPSHQVAPGEPCGTCHFVVMQGFAFVNPSLHIDGKVQWNQP